MAKWIVAGKTKAGLRHAVVRPNVTGRTKKRIAKASGLVLVRSPLLTSHKWRELVSSGRLVCRCHGVFSLVLRLFLKKNLDASRPSEHPPVWGKKCQNV